MWPFSSGCDSHHFKNPQPREEYRSRLLYGRDDDFRVYVQRKHVYKCVHHGCLEQNERWINEYELDKEDIAEYEVNE